MDEQDWTPVTIRRRGGPRPAGYVQKISTAQRQINQAGQHAAAIERKAEEGNLKTKKVSAESRQLLVQTRLTNKWSQQEADTQCNLPKGPINRIEAGTLLPDGTTLSKIRRALKIDLKFV
jgi:ribosome-binding protein aMBF1 (putative translation factor)